MTIEVRTPFGAPAAIELSSDGLYRKQVLKFETINYTGRDGKKRKITFDRAYGQDLIDAFKDGAYEQVPFQLADADNRHTNDVTRTGGEVVALSLTPDGSGVDAALRVWGAGHKTVELNSKLGVSARILENVDRPDGRHFPRAMQHVLGTVDPQVTGMRPWEKISSVELATGPVTESLDLSTATYERSADMAEDSDGTVTLELSTAQAERLRNLLDEDEALEALAEELGDDFFDSLDDDEADESDEPEDEEGDGVNLSGHGEAIELANAQLASQETRILELTNQLNEERTDNEVAEYRRQSLSPAVLDLARPLLAVPTGAIELSNGGPDGAIDPAEIMREVLTAVIELASSGHLMLDSDAEVGDLRGQDKQSGDRAALIADWENYG